MEEEWQSCEEEVREAARRGLTDRGNRFVKHCSDNDASCRNSLQIRINHIALKHSKPPSIRPSPASSRVLRPKCSYTVQSTGKTCEGPRGIATYTRGRSYPVLRGFGSESSSTMPDLCGVECQRRNVQAGCKTYCTLLNSHGPSSQDSTARYPHLSPTQLFPVRTSRMRICPCCLRCLLHRYFRPSKAVSCHEHRVRHIRISRSESSDAVSLACEYRRLRAFRTSKLRNIALLCRIAISLASLG